MYEKFTDRARKVMQLANQESQKLNHEFIGTEHILLGLLKEGSGTGALLLEKGFGLYLKDVYAQIAVLVQPGPDMVIMGKLPHTPRTKKVIEYAIEESRLLGHNYVGTEHILLGLLREEEGVAAQVLMNCGISLEVSRKYVKALCEATLRIPHDEPNRNEHACKCKKGDGKDYKAIVDQLRPLLIQHADLMSKIMKVFLE
jgi:ATP-dependent Clp protease ATP-binding subunit ClpC